MAKPRTQVERLARRDDLRAELSKLEAQERDIQAEMAELLEDCDHTNANGQSAIIGGRTKVCAHCGRIVIGKGEKLWG